jgi:hypothetical protein
MAAAGYTTKLDVTIARGLLEVQMTGGGDGHAALGVFDKSLLQSPDDAKGIQDALDPVKLDDSGHVFSSLRAPFSVLFATRWFL